MGVCVHALAVHGVRKQPLRGADGHRGGVLVPGGAPQQLPGGPG